MTKTTIPMSSTDPDSAASAVQPGEGHPSTLLTEVADPSTAQGRAMVIADPLFDSVSKFRVVNLCHCVVGVRAAGQWDDSSPIADNFIADPKNGELEFALDAPGSATSGSFGVSVTYKDGSAANYPADGSDFHVLRAAGQTALTADIDQVVRPAGTSEVATAALPIPAYAPSEVRTDTLAAFIPEGDAESFGPSVVAASDSAVYVADPVNRRISRYDSRGDLRQVNLNLPVNYLRDLSAMAVDEIAAVIYLQVNDTIHAIDLNGSGERWRSRIAGAVYRSLVVFNGSVTVLVGSRCTLLDPLSGKAGHSSNARGLCIIPDVRAGNAVVLIQIDGENFATVRFTGAGTIVRVEVGHVDVDTRTVFGTLHIKDEKGVPVTKAFAVNTKVSKTMVLKESPDHRFSTAMPLTDASGATGIWYSDGAIHVEQIAWGKE